MDKHTLLGLALLGSVEAEMRGDTDNARALHQVSTAMDEMIHGASWDEAVTANEKRGQAQVVHSDRLPRDNNLSREQMEQLGFTFGEEGSDPLFVLATLPPGWEKRGSDHAMWSYLYDEQGRCRASLFYKADFWDRAAHISFSPRYTCSVDPVGGWKDFRHDVPACYEGVVKDAGTIIWRTAPTEPEPEYKHTDPEAKRQVRLAWDRTKDALGEAVKAWLNERYPDWRNPVAHW